MTNTVGAIGIFQAASTAEFAAAVEAGQATETDFVLLEGGLRAASVEDADLYRALRAGDRQRIVRLLSERKRKSYLWQAKSRLGHLSLLAPKEVLMQAVASALLPILKPAPSTPELQSQAAPPGEGSVCYPDYGYFYQASGRRRTTFKDLWRRIREGHPVEKTKPEREYRVQRINPGDDTTPIVAHQAGDANPILVLSATEQLGEVAAITDRGVGKDKRNEDRVLIVRDKMGNLHLVDFDGVGGGGKEGDGKIASKVAAEAYAETVKETGDPQKGYEAADQAVRDFNLQKFASEGGAATVAVSALITPGGEVHFHWAGDVRGALYEPMPDSQLYLAYRTLGDAAVLGMHDRRMPLSSEFLEQIDSVNLVSNAIGKARFFGTDGMAVRNTQNGLVPDSGSESGFRFADELESGIKLKLGSVVILASDGGIFFWEDVPDIIQGLDSAEAMLKALHEEAHYRMKILTEAYFPRNVTRAPFTYQGRVSRLKGKKIFIDRLGRVYDSPSTEQPVARFRYDHVSIIVYRHNPQTKK